MIIKTWYYTANQLDRDVVSDSQILTVLQQFRDKVLPDAFPGRNEVPKTLIFAKDDSHADDIVQIVRDEFGKGDDFAVKITYKSTGRKTDDMISEFRNSYNPRIVVTVAPSISVCSVCAMSCGVRPKARARA